ncbi:unnamed protein product, partial [Nesidiocoris tenuis]
TYLGQFSDVIGVEQEFFKASGISEDILGDIGQGAVPLVHILNLAIASLEDRNAAEHDCSRALPMSAMLDPMSTVLHLRYEEFESLRQGANLPNRTGTLPRELERRRGHHSLNTTSRARTEHRMLRYKITPVTEGN